MLSTVLAATLAVNSNPWTMVVGGDIMLNAVSAKQNPFAAIAPAMKSADIAYANLEVPLTTVRTGTPRKSAAEIKARSQYILKADPAHAKWLAVSGIDVVSLANNHAMDYGDAGRIQMVKALEAQGVAHTGAGTNLAEARRPAVLTVKGKLRIGFISSLSFLTEGAIYKCWPATAKAPGIAGFTVGGATNKASDTKVRAIVTEAKKHCDILVVCLHWGVEKQTVPKAYQVTLGRQFLTQGADVVLGAHPHVLQGAELYGKKPLFYSLGNFTSPKSGATALFRLHFDGKTYKSAEIIPYRYSVGVTSLPKAAAAATAASGFRQLSNAMVRAFPHKSTQAIHPNLAK